MKKILGSIIVSLCAILVVGCGSEKKLNCSKDFSDSMPYNIKMVQDSEIDFESNKIKTLKMVMSFEIPESSSINTDTIMKSMKTTYDNQYGKYEGVTVTQEKTSDSEFKITINVDCKNLSDSDKTAIGLVGSETYSANKESLEASGYTCK